MCTVSAYSEICYADTVGKAAHIADTQVGVYLNGHAIGGVIDRCGYFLVCVLIRGCMISVSYTHLTLPTRRTV